MVRELRRLMPTGALGGARLAWAPARTVCLSLAVALASCGRQSPHGKQESGRSTVTTVGLPVTPVDNQGRFGVCWAYGTVGLVESELKKSSGKTINLSEEALAFYFLSEHITKIIRDSGSFVKFFEATSRGLNEGYFSRIAADKKQPGQLDAFDLIARYGLVPETSWNFKITSGAQRDELMRNLRRKAIQYLNGRDLRTVTVQEVMEFIMVGDGAFPSKPPDSFRYEGRRFSALQFVREVLKFEPANFVAIEARSEAELGPWISVVKRALAQGYTVPFGFPINVSRINGNAFGSDGVSLDDARAFAADGGHLVLLTDFVNAGGREGQVTPDELARELARPPSDLDYLRFKNSWGIGAKTDGEGRAISLSQDGYYSLTRGYLVGAARAAVKGYLPLNAVVPQSALLPQR